MGFITILLEVMRMSYRYTIDDLHNDIVLGVPSEATKYLFDRIQRLEYRGEHLSQHNRYTKEVILVILEELNNVLQSNNLTLLPIRTTDLSKRGFNTPEEYHYAVLTNAIAKRINRVTQDSLRKNFFVDMARMGFINRFQPNRCMSSPFEKSKTKFVNISELGYEFLKASQSQNIFNINRLWTDALTNLHNGFEVLLYDFMLNLQLRGENSISYDEFAFFVSDLRITSPNILLELLLEFKRLSLYQKESVINAIRKYASPKDNEVFERLDKTKVKDYHNWINEAQQLFMLLDESVLFGVGDFRDKELNIRTGEMGLISNNTQRLQRSTAQKNEYYKQHGIDPKLVKGLGFELHHIVPLAYARNQNEFSVLDRWENMILIDGHKHAIITQNGSRNILADFDGVDINFTSFQIPKHVVNCIYDVNIKYNPSLINIIQETNKSILQSL